LSKALSPPPESGANGRANDEPWDDHRGADVESFEAPDAAARGIIGLMKREPVFVRHAHALLEKG
jgi:hypothetical protein